MARLAGGKTRQFASDTARTSPGVAVKGEMDFSLKIIFARPFRAAALFGCVMRRNPFA
jgi:hypothetical protein